MKNYIRYLGILIDSNLSWKFHIDYVCQKVSKTIGIIAKLRHFVPRHVLLTLYPSLILPYISYGICAWGHAAETQQHLNITNSLFCPCMGMKLHTFPPNFNPLNTDSPLIWTLSVAPAVSILKGLTVLYCIITVYLS